MIGGETMRFRTGIGRKPALEFSYEPLLFLGHPGAKGRVKVTLRNQTKMGLKGTVTAVPKDRRIAAGPRVHRFEVEPEGFAGFECDVRIDSAASTSYLPISFRPSFAVGEGGDVEGREEIYHASCVAPGGLLAAIDPEAKFLDLQNDRLRVSISVREGGATRIRDRVTGSMVVDGPTWDALGPPFWPTEFAHRECEFALERGDRFVVAKIYMRSEVHRGLTLFKEYTLRSGSPLVTIQYGLVNDHPKARSFELQTGCRRTWKRPPSTCRRGTA